MSSALSPRRQSISPAAALQPFDRQVALRGLLHVAQQAQQLAQAPGVQRQQRQVQHQRRIDAGQRAIADEGQVGGDAAHPQWHHRAHRIGAEGEQRTEVA
jgi:hypothetical protein